MGSVVACAVHVVLRWFMAQGLDLDTVACASPHNKDTIAMNAKDGKTD